MPFVELHMAKSIDELMKKAEQHLQPNLHGYTAERFYTLTQSLFSEGLKHQRNCDDERAYIVFYRYMDLCSKLNDSLKKEYLAKVPHDRVKIVCDRLEALQTKLKKRYEEKAKSHEERKSMIFNNSSSSLPVPGTSVKVDTTLENGDVDAEEENDDEYPTVDPTELVETISLQSSQISKVLIIDIRSKEKFTESSIAANKMQAGGQVYLVNVPSSILTPGITCSALLKSLTLGLALDCFERRRTMDRIVIMDERTAQFEKDSMCTRLAMALYKWDHSADRIKKKPYLLKGGYVDFVLTYPTYVTNPDIIMMEANRCSTSPLSKQLPLKGLYDFDEENNAEEEKKLTNNNRSAGHINNAEVNGRALPPSPQPQKSSMVNGLINKYESNVNRLNDRSNTSPGSFGLSNKVPGIAKPIIPDRSSKPTLQQNSHSLPRNHDNDVTMKDAEDDDDQNYRNSLRSTPDSKNLNHDYLNNQNKVINKKLLTNPSELLKKLPPKPEHLLNNNVTNEENNSSNNYRNSQINGFSHTDKLTDHGDKKMQISSDDDDDDLVAGQFDDIRENGTASGRKALPSNVLQTPVHRRGEVKFPIEEDMSDDEENEPSVPASLAHSSALNRSKPILMNRPMNGTTNNNNNNSYYAPSSLSRSLSSPNIAQIEESQDIHFPNSFGTPKSHPIVDRAVKPSYLQSPRLQELRRKPREFSPQSSSSRTIPGLKNLGSTCYMNAILQCLNNTNELSQKLVSDPVHINENSKFGSNGELAIELIELFKHLTVGYIKYISPKDLKNAVIRHIPDFVECKQQDAHEYLVLLLDRVHADLNECADMSITDPAVKDPNYYDNLSLSAAANRFWQSYSKSNRSIVTDLFQGLLINTVTCQQCNYTSKSLEAFTCLSLPIQECGRTTIQNSIRMFIRQEQLSEEANWQCPTCKQTRDAQRCTYIWRLPKVLIIQLKRFTYDGMWRRKINTFVDFPIEDLQIEARDGARSYSLYGVVEHTGTLEGGHYIAYSRNLDLNIGWYKYDDADVSLVSPSEVITQHAYVLFYKQTKAS